ncbi:MAG: LOG family protein [Candidatus Hydrogenedentota bacterium]|nr:MAG: LOG family protein [Candidatus Hydrogenedentota bacterium]
MPRAERQEPMYLQKDFMESAAARELRILAEYLYPLKTFRKYNIQDIIVFFGSARIPHPRITNRELRKVDYTNLSSAENEKLHKKRKLKTYYEQATKLAYLLTKWSKSLPEGSRRFVVTSGGGPGIMEAANRGASLARGLSIGLNIELPFEQIPNEYITPSLSFDFHYFFMRKFWFMYLAKALIVFPGGFGTLDELFEALTLEQTQKSNKEMPIVLFGREYWSEIIDFDRLVDWGMISPEDKDIIFFADDVEHAFDYLKAQLTKHYL